MEPQVEVVHRQVEVVRRQVEAPHRAEEVQQEHRVEAQRRVEVRHPLAHMMVPTAQVAL